jgi:DNA-binding transcriptional MerR regulator
MADDTVPDTDPSPRFAVDDIAALAGVTPRTVRYYIAQGLIDKPAGEKRGAHYLRQHLEQLLAVRRWTESGLSLDRIRELRAGAPQDPPRRTAAPGAVEVWSRMTLADGLELQIEPGRAGLSPQQLRLLLRGVLALYQQLRAEVDPQTGPGDGRPTARNDRSDTGSDADSDTGP